MKKSSVTSISLLLGLLFVLFSCGSADKAEKTANKFFSLIINGNTAQAVSICIDGQIDKAGMTEAIEYFRKNDEAGKLLSAKKGLGFNTSIENGVTKVALPYLLKYEKYEKNVEVQLIDQGSGFKIVSVQ